MQLLQHELEKVMENERGRVGEASDEAILRESIKHPNLFSLLIRRYEAAFVRKVMGVVGNKEDAEDIVQETFTKIYLYAPKFQTQEGASFKSWAYKILLNTSFTQYQKNKKKWAHSTALTDELMAVLPVETREQHNLEMRDYIASVLLRMSEPFAQVLSRYFLEGKNQAEIAALEGISVGAVKTRMHRAKKEFQKVVASITP